MYKTLKFRKLSLAKKKARQMKKSYGYLPTVFKETDPKTKKKKYIVVKPKRLKKI